MNINEETKDQTLLIKKPKAQKQRKEKYDEEDRNKSNDSIINESCLILKKTDGDALVAISEQGGDIGREKTCDIYIPDLAVSKKNSKIIFTKGGYYISDKKSLNGTFVKMDINNLNKIQIEVKMIVELNNFLIKVLEVKNTLIEIEISKQEDDSQKFYEKIAFFEEKFFYLTIDDEHPKG